MLLLLLVSGCTPTQSKFTSERMGGEIVETSRNWNGLLPEATGVSCGGNFVLYCGNCLFEMHKHRRDLCGVVKRSTIPLMNTNEVFCKIEKKQMNFP